MHVHKPPWTLYKLSSWSKVLENLRVPQAIKTHTDFYRTREFINVFSEIQLWNLPWATFIQLTSSFSSSIHIFKLCLCPHLGHQNGILPHRLRTNTLYAVFIASTRTYKCFTSQHPSLEHPNSAWRGVQVTKTLHCALFLQPPATPSVVTNTKVSIS
jgi:hypothetical protein